MKEEYEAKLKQKDDLQRQAELTELKLDRAAKLVSGLAGERERWKETAEVNRLVLSIYTHVCMYHDSVNSIVLYWLQRLEVSISYLPGDCLVAAAFLSYAGPFLSHYRDELVQNTWLKQVSNLHYYPLAQICSSTAKHQLCLRNCMQQICEMLAYI